MLLLFINLFFSLNLSYAYLSEVTILENELRITSENPLVEKLLKQEVQYIDIKDPTNSKTTHRIEVLYEGNMPTEFLLNYEHRFSIKDHLMTDSEMKLERAQEVFINKIDGVMLAMHDFILNAEELKHKPLEVSKNKLYVLEWSHRSLAILSDATGVLLIGLSMFSPLPFTSILVLKFLAKPIAKASYRFYQQASAYQYKRSRVLSQNNKPYTYSMFKIYNTLERKIFDWTNSTRIYLNNQRISLVTPSKACRNLFF